MSEHLLNIHYDVFKGIQLKYKNHQIKPCITLQEENIARVGLEPTYLN